MRSEKALQKLQNRPIENDQRTIKAGKKIRVYHKKVPLRLVKTKGRNKGQVLTECVFCKKNLQAWLTTKRPFCDKACRDSFNKSLTKGELQRQYKGNQWNGTIRSQNRKWNKNLTLKPCAHCGYTKHVELAHIQAVASFDDTATLGTINHPNNIIQLCPNCHWEFDRGRLSLSDFKIL